MRMASLGIPRAKSGYGAQPCRFPSPGSNLKKRRRDGVVDEKLSPMSSSLFSEKSSPNRFSRRSFLLRGARSLAALTLAPALLNGCGSSAETYVVTGNAPAALPLDSLQRMLDGSLLRPDSADFAALARPWNLRYADRLPAAIARCASLEDIAESLAWARTNGVPFVTRSGGHSYSGFSTTNGLLIDISQLRSVNYDPDSGVVRLGPGARNKTVYDSLREPSTAITHGRCLEVGVSGLCLGGGIGFNMRLHGLTCDQLVSTDILLADGRQLTLSETQNADLYWAVRGAGGGNFGIHTSFTFQTFPVSEVTMFNITWNSEIPALFARLLELMPTFPRELGIKLTLLTSRNPTGQKFVTFNLLGQLVGSPNEVLDLFADLFALAQPIADQIEEMPYWDAQSLLSEAGDPEFSHERSRLMDGPLSAEGQNTVLEHLAAWPGLDGTADWKIFLTGGAVADITPDATAYVHRQAFGVSSTELEWHHQEDAAVVADNRRWLDEFHQAMAEFTSQRSYQNFIDADQPDYLRAYYGANLERLVQVKAAYDPNNVFHYPQSVPVSL